MVMQLSTSLASCSFVGSSTSQAAKLRRTKYCPEMSAGRISSSNISFNPANLLVFISTTTSEIMRESLALDISGIGKMTLPWKYGEYLPLYSSGLICRTFQGAGVLLPVGLCPVYIGLTKELIIAFFLAKRPEGRAN